MIYSLEIPFWLDTLNTLVSCCEKVKHQPVCAAEQHIEAVGQDEAYAANLCGQQPRCGHEHYREQKQLLVVPESIEQ